MFIKVGYSYVYMHIHAYIHTMYDKLAASSAWAAFSNI